MTVREIMILTGALGASLGLFLRDPERAFLGGLLLILFWLVLKRWLYKIPLAIRLVVEIATLLSLLYFSSIVWTPSFYVEQADRCVILASKARQPSQRNPERQAALDREARWFDRRGADLRLKGRWLGLILGRSTRDPRLEDLGSEFGTLESMEKHEKTLNALLDQP